MYFHGGGFAVGDLDTTTAPPASTQLKPAPWVVSVDYRLAPSTLSGRRRRRLGGDPVVADNAGRFGADGSWLAVAGDSAGGTLSAVVASSARDNGGPRWRSSCSGTRRRCGTPRCRPSPRTPRRRFWTTPRSRPSPAGMPGEVDLTDPRRGWPRPRHLNLSGLPPATSPSRATTRARRRRPLRRTAVRRRCAGRLHNAETLVHGYLGYAGVVPATTEGDRARSARPARRIAQRV